MKAEHWKEIERLYDASIELDPAQRAQFLANACSNDEVRRNVELLLAHREVPATFIERPGLQVAAEMFTHNSGEAWLGRTIDQYQVLSLIGAGGMGIVYRARDLRLGRDVALKVLPDEFSQDRERVIRWEREARILASLNHPHIAAIYDLKETEKGRCLVLEYVEGETLASRLKHGRLPIAEGLNISRQVAGALEAAHEQGIVHRDIKPGNVMITISGGVKVLDFGIAKTFVETDAQIDSNATALTEAGMILGTPAYLSPEQLRGEPGNKQSDVWAFGCLLYEVLTGRQPFWAKITADTIACVLKGEPEWSALPEATPSSVRDLLQHCLQKDSYLRLQNIAEAGATLQAALAGRDIARSPESDSSIRSLAVLPFANGSSNPQMEYLSDGLTENIILGLSRLPQLHVMSRSAAFRYKGRTDDVQEIGRRLGVGVVLTGNVLQRGETLLIHAELVDVQTGWQLWGDQYRRKSIDIFAIEEDIAREISEKLRLKLTPEKKKLLAKRYTENVEAYHLYLKGKFHWGKRTVEGLNRAIQYFRQAIEDDPTYALAYAGMAEGYIPLGMYCHLAPKDAFPKARSAAEKALEIDPLLTEAMAVLGSVKTHFEWDLAGAEEELRRAVELYPKYPRAHQVLSECLGMRRQFKEAVEEAKQALELDPLSLHMNAYVTLTYYFVQQYDEAIEHGRRTVELDPHFYPGYFYLGLSYAARGRHSDAVPVLEQATVLSNNSTMTLAALGAAFGSGGKLEDARKILRDLEDLRRRKYVSQVYVARIHAGIGERDRAIDCLEQAFEDRCPWLPRSLVSDWALDCLRDDPRFMDISRRVGV